MMNKNGKKKFKLLNFVISVESGSLSACEYVYFLKENIVRESIHPARIDMEKNMLIIDMTNSSGKDTSLAVNKIAEILSDLPQWAGTKYYHFKSNGKDEMYLCSGNIAVKHSKLPIQIIK